MELTPNRNVIMKEHEANGMKDLMHETPNIAGLNLMFYKDFEHEPTTFLGIKHTMKNELIM